MSYAPSPQVDVAHLEELSMYLERNEDVPRDIIAKCRKMGRALVGGVAAGWGWTTLTACAAAEWDVAEARRLAEEAVRQVGPEPVLLCNLAVSFKHLAQPADALRFSGWAYQQAPHNTTAVKTHCDDLFASGRLSAGARVARDALYLPDAEDDYGSVQAFAELFTQTLEDLKRAEVAEEQLQAELAIAQDVLFETRNRYDGLQVRCDNDPEDGTCSLAVSFTFFGTVEDEMHIGAVLAPKLSELPRWDPCVLNTGYAYLQREYADESA